MEYPIDPELAVAVEMLPRLDFDNPNESRAMLRKLASQLAPPDSSGVTISEQVVPGPTDGLEIPVRLYRPLTPSGPVGVLDLHPGGFVVGDLDLDHVSNLTIAREVGAVVVSVDYRLAPEHPYPAALEDSYAALRWFADNAERLRVDPTRIAIHGVSAGGGLCAALGHLARDRGGPAITFQCLGMPELDDRMQTASIAEFTDTPMLTSSAVASSWNAYLGAGVPGTSNVSAYAAPARATDLSGLPPAYVSVMAFDPLRDEGIAYALALQSAGNQVELHMFPGTFHASAMVEHAAISQRELAEKITVLRRGLGVTVE